MESGDVTVERVAYDCVSCIGKTTPVADGRNHELHLPSGSFMRSAKLRLSLPAPPLSSSRAAAQCHVRPWLYTTGSKHFSLPCAQSWRQNDTTASAASSFLKTLLAAARSEATADPQLAAEAAAACTGTCTAAAAGSQPPTAAGPPSSHWVALWRGALLAALYSGSEKLRSYVSVHALPVVLGLEPTAALELIRAALSDPRPEPVPGTSRVAAVVAVLKVGVGRSGA